MSEQPIVVVAGCELPNDLALERERLAPIGAEIVDARDLEDGPLMRQLERASALLTEGFMALDGAVLRPINGLHGQTLGLLGYGEIARAVAARARAFGMEIIAHDPYVAPDIAATE